MVIKIPREVFWHDRVSMDELLHIPLFSALHEVFFKFEQDPLLFPMNELVILNEVGYQVTWLCYESRLGLTPDMRQFKREIFANTGLKDHAMTVVSLVYATVKLVNFPPLDVSSYAIRELEKMHKESWCRRYVDAFVNRIARNGAIFEERFLPNQAKLESFLMIIEQWKDDEVHMCAEAEIEDVADNKDRAFTLNEIVEYCKNQVEFKQVSGIIQMLYYLLRMKGDPSEYQLVDGIQDEFKNRRHGDAVSGNKTSVGDNSNMVNFVLPPNVDYEKLFKAIPPEIKDIWRKQLQLTQEDNE